MIPVSYRTVSSYGSTSTMTQCMIEVSGKNAARTRRFVMAPPPRAGPQPEALRAKIKPARTYGITEVTPVP